MRVELQFKAYSGRGATQVIILTLKVQLVTFKVQLEMFRQWQFFYEPYLSI